MTKFEEPGRREGSDKRQVPDVSAALQHNIGLGGAVVVTAYQRAERRTMRTRLAALSRCNNV